MPGADGASVLFGHTSRTGSAVFNRLRELHAGDVVAVSRADAAIARFVVDRVGSFLVHLLKPDLFILWGIALVAFAISRERPRVALAVAAVLALAPFTAETLKPLLAHPHVRVGDVQIGAASWPSGHATAAMALVLSAVLVAPARLRPAVAVLGGGFAVAVGFFLLVLAWHMPSDVLGGYLVAALWASLAVAALRAAENRWPTGKPL